MNLRTVTKLPDPILRRKAHKVSTFDKELQILIDDMIATMRNEPGVGLAAPQVNVSIQVIVVEYPLSEDEENELPNLFIMVNPEIVEMGAETVLGIEGCLSVPGLVGEVERSTKILIKGFDRFGRKQKVQANGWLARIFQHEIDHINGILFVDRTINVWKPEPEQTSEQIISE